MSQLPSEWETVLLGDVCGIALGKTPARRSPRYWDIDKTTDNVWLSIADLSNCVNSVVSDSKEYISDEGAALGKIVKEGTLLVSFKLTLGRLAFAGRDLYTNEAIAALTINDEARLSKFYLYWYFTFFDWQKAAERDEKVKGKTLNKEKLKVLKVILPPLPEQKRIVATLDEVFEGITQTVDTTEKNLANARELFESYLNNVFSQKSEEWVEKTLKDVSVDFGRGKSKHRPRNDPKLYDGPYPFIQTGDVRNSKHLIISYSQTYNEIGLAQSKLWPKGTICITIAANIAETGILDFDACFPDSIIGIVVDETQTTNTFVEFLLQSVKARIKAKGKGSAQDNINLNTFEKEFFPFPSLNEQEQIVEKLTSLSMSVETLETIYQKKLDVLAELKQSILQKAFTGELTN